MIPKNIFREYDIRGVYKKDFDEGFATELAKAHSTFLFKKTGKKQLRVSVGYDARISSPSLAQAAIEGFKKSGLEIYK